MARCQGAHAGRAHGAVACSPVALQRPAGDKVFPSSTRRARWWCWTRWRREGLTRKGCRRRGGGRVPRRWCLSMATELRSTPAGGGDLRVDLRHGEVKTKVMRGSKGKTMATQAELTGMTSRWWRYGHIRRGRRSSGEPERTGV
jgi:hypothetical protein